MPKPIIHVPKSVIWKHTELKQIKAKEKKISSFNKKTPPIYKKKVSETAIDSFFEKLENGTFRKFFNKRVKNEARKSKDELWVKEGKIIPNKQRIVFPVTKSVLGTVRIFTNKHNLDFYLSSANRFYDKVEERNNHFENFTIQPINILGIKKLLSGKYAILEKVYPTQSAFEYISIDKKDIEENRYHKFTDNFLKNKDPKINSQEFYTQLKKAVKEYDSTFKNIADMFSGNILVLDYNPKTKKFLFGPIDFAGSTESLP